MTEKYKIYIPEEMRSRLMNDAELFEFTKNDGSVNLNAFLKELLVNYFDQYREAKKQLLDTILSDLSEYSSITDTDAGAIADKIINTYMRSGEYGSGRNATITLTVSGRSLDVMSSIENNMLAQVSLSQYINDMLSSYLSISRSNREMIIFRDTFEDLNKAIKSNRIITFSSTSSPGPVFTIRPYMIATSKEEQCNYLLCTDDRFGQPSGTERDRKTQSSVCFQEYRSKSGHERPRHPQVPYDHKEQTGCRAQRRQHVLFQLAQTPAGGLFCAFRQRCRHRISA